MRLGAWECTLIRWREIDDVIYPVIGRRNGGGRRGREGSLP